MKFVHIADVHLGMQPDFGFPWSEIRKRELYDTFFKVVDFCIEESVDLLLIAGDLFHRQPNHQELKDIFYAFNKLKKTQVVLIAGNHDYIGASSLYNTETWPKHVKLLAKDIIEVYHLRELDTYIYGYSYGTRDVKENRLSELHPIKTDGYHILLAHAGDALNNPITRQEILNTPFDYVALGHIHKPERIGERAAYAGSLEPLDKTEVGTHGFIMGTLSPQGCYLRFVNFARRRYMQLSVEIEPSMTIHAIYDKIKRLLSEQGKQNIYKLLLEGTVSSELKLEKEVLYTMGNIVEVENQTHSDYDYMKLYYENQDNIVGMYIDAIRNMDLKDEDKDMALYYGVKAFADSKK